jgi:hypothetical protein
VSLLQFPFIVPLQRQLTWREPVYPLK